MKIRHLPVVCALFGATLSVSATAASINVQFGSDTYIGPGAETTGSGGIYWNFYKNSSGHRMLGLKDSHGAETQVVIWVTYESTFQGGPAPTTTGGKGRNPGHLLGSGLHGPIELNIHLHDPAKTYDVYAYVSNASNAPTTVTLTDANGTTVRTPSPVNNDKEFRLNENYVVFSNVVPIGEYGRLILKVDGEGTGLNGVQFHSTPTPPPLQDPPFVRVRSKSGTVTARTAGVALHGTARSDAGIRTVWTSVDRNTWRKARGTTEWTAVVAAPKRTRVFVRAEDVNGTFSAVESVVIVPKRKR